MFDIADTVLAWQQTGRPVIIARLIETVGFSSLDREHVAALSAGAPIAGALLSGVADGQLRAAIAAGTTRRVIDVSVTDDEAATAGLSCGGRARVLLQDATDIEPAAWAALIEREPGCLITRIDAGDRVGATHFYPAGAIDAAEERYGPGVRRLLARGTTQTTLLPGTEWTAAVSVLWPVPSLLVVGSGQIAQALDSTAALLGWSTEVVEDADRAVAALAGRTLADAVVVLSHDPEVGGTTLAAALAGRIGYVGALGSRRTQAARRAWLTACGVSTTAIDQIHGPAGLDIGAYGAAEIAVAIVAEIIANRTAASGSALRNGSGPLRPI